MDKLRNSLYAISPYSLGTLKDDMYRDAVDSILETFLPIVVTELLDNDNISTSISNYGEWNHTKMKEEILKEVHSLKLK